jgi:hypothetical protein
MSSVNRVSASPIVRFNLVASFFFIVVAVTSAIVFDDVFRVVIVVVSLALFAVGVATFLIGFCAAAKARSPSPNSSS